MAELVGYDTLQLITIKGFKRSPGNADYCIIRFKSGCKGIDALFYFPLR